MTEVLKQSSGKGIRMTTQLDIPNFLYIGAAKCASTWIFRSLQAHPQVFVPAVKDIFFFDREYDRGLDWYQSVFAEAGPQHVRIGELSHFYLYSPEVAERIHATLPAAKLIACVRNPIRRAWSAYLFKKRNGLTSADFETALVQDPEMKTRGLYAPHVATYQSLFPVERLKILVYDDLEVDPVAFGKQIYSFLDIDPDFDNPFAHRKVLPASRPRSAVVAALARRASRIVRKLGMIRLLGKIKSSESLAGMLYVPLEEGKRERMPAEQWNRLADYYQKDVERLSSLLNRDLSHWLVQSAK